MSKVFCSILNKITATKFDFFANRTVEELAQADDETVTGFTDSVFNAAGRNPALSPVFAGLVATVIQTLNNEEKTQQILQKVDEKMCEEFPKNTKFVAELYKARVGAETIESVLTTSVTEKEKICACCEFVQECKQDLEAHKPDLLNRVIECMQKGSETTEATTKVKFQVQNVMENHFSTPQAVAPQDIMIQEPSKERTVYVSHIDCTGTEGSLMALLTSCGEVTKIRLCGNTTQSTQYAFVEYATSTGAKSAIRSLEGQRYGHYTLHCTLSRNMIHDKDNTDAVNHVKACTFGMDPATLGWNNVPLTQSGHQQAVAYGSNNGVKRGTSQRNNNNNGAPRATHQQYKHQQQQQQQPMPSLTGDQILYLDEPRRLQYLMNLADPTPTLLSLMKIGETYPEPVVHTLGMWCFRGNLLTAWVQRAYQQASMSTVNPVGIAMLGKRLIDNRILKA
eukprot:PhF_6_TR673/c3_g1_i1/m.1027